MVNGNWGLETGDWRLETGDWRIGELENWRIGEFGVDEVPRFFLSRWLVPARGLCLSIGFLFGHSRIECERFR